MEAEKIHISSTWGIVGALYVRLAESQEVKAIQSTLTPEQRDIMSKTLIAELTKQGF